MTNGPINYTDLLAELSLAHPDRYTAPACRCAVCVQRSMRGEEALAGMSIHPEMHVLSDEFTSEHKPTRAERLEAERAAKAAAAANEAARRRAAKAAQPAKLIPDALAKAIVEVMVLHFRESIAPVLARLDALEAAQRRLDNFRYVGVWRAGTEYSTGNFSTHDGGLWHANTDGTTSEPGSDATWSLCVKRGRDARERKGKP